MTPKPPYIVNEGGAQQELSGEVGRAEFVPLYSKAAHPEGGFLGRRFRLPDEAAAAKREALREAEELADPYERWMARHEVRRRAPHASVAAWDCTFSPPKSVSLLWAAGHPELQRQVWAAHLAAVDAGLGYLEEHAGYVRAGRNGVRVLDTTGLVVARMNEWTSRDGDMHLHTHCLILNRAQAAEDGRWRALDGRALLAARTGAGALYNRALEAELTRRLGLGWRDRPDGLRELAGVDDELIEAFSFEGINKSNAVVNFKEDDPFDPKAVWLNSQHIYAMPPEELAEQLLPFLCAAGYRVERRKLLQVTPLIRERIKVLRDAAAVADFFFLDELPPYNPAELVPQKGDAALALRVLQRARPVLETAEFTHSGLETALRAEAERLGVKAGQMFQPIRVAVCGRKTAPPLFETLEVLGRDTCLKRIDQAIRKLPAGTWPGESRFDVPGGEVVTLHTAVTIDNQKGEILIDFTGSSPKSPRGVNVVLNYTHAYASFAIKAAICPDVPHNEGSFRPVHVSAPPGSILNALDPAPVASRQVIGHFIPSAIFAALSGALPGRLMAPGADPIWLSVWRGQDPPFTLTIFQVGGTGARAGSTTTWGKIRYSTGLTFDGSRHARRSPAASTASASSATST